MKKIAVFATLALFACVSQSAFCSDAGIPAKEVTIVQEPHAFDFHSSLKFEIVRDCPAIEVQTLNSVIVEDLLVCDESCLRLKYADAPKVIYNSIHKETAHAPPNILRL